MNTNALKSEILIVNKQKGKLMLCSVKPVKRCVSRIPIQFYCSFSSKNTRVVTVFLYNL